MNKVKVFAEIMIPVTYDMTDIISSSMPLLEAALLNSDLVMLQLDYYRCVLACSRRLKGIVFFIW